MHSEAQITKCMFHLQHRDGDHKMSITRAIIIGISKYSKAEDCLPCARPSAELLCATLAERYAFDRIDLLCDREATLDGITAALSGLESLDRTDAALIAFCGHAKKMGDRWYFVPQDSSMKDTHHRKFLPEYELFIEYMEKIRAGHIFLIIDACYGGLLLQRRGITNEAGDINKAVVEELMSPDRPSRFAMTAGDASEPVLDGGGNSVSIFTEEMCDYLNAFKGEVLSATVLASEMKTRVLSRLQHGVVRQHPLAGHLGRELGGIFCFVKKETKDSTPNHSNLIYKAETNEPLCVREPARQIYQAMPRRQSYAAQINESKMSPIAPANEASTNLSPSRQNQAEQSLVMWTDIVSSTPEQTAINDSACAWIMKWTGFPLSRFQLAWARTPKDKLNYAKIMPIEAKQALVSWKREEDRTESEKYIINEEPNQMRIEEIDYDHRKHKTIIYLSKIGYLYYAAIHKQLGKPALESLRTLVFKNALQGLIAKVQLLLPSQFAVHMAVVSKEGQLLIRQRTEGRQLFPAAWEATCGEFMHGPLKHKFRHFNKKGDPDLFLFLKEAVREELDYDGAKESDFKIYGFAVEYETLAPKLLAVYSSDLPIDVLINGSIRDETDDPAQTAKGIELTPDNITDALCDPERVLKGWSPCSKLAMMIALCQTVDSPSGKATILAETKAMFQKKSQKL